jgi:SAM-dependent methyltransferase
MFLKTSLKQGTILDAGSGDGSLSLQLARQGFSVCAVEPDEKWCAIFSRRLENSEFKNKIRIVCASLEDAAFSPGSFDAIVCGEVLEHLDNDVEAIKKFYSLLKKGGVLILTVPLEGKGWDAWDDISGHLRLYNFSALGAKLVSAGFSLKKALSWGYPFAKFYHRCVFLKWGNRVKTEEEIIKTRRLSTRIGKSFAASVLGIIFFIDLFFTPADKGIGVIIKAQKH